LDKPICVIPARAGSKRVPGKNTRLLGGKPLVQWIIEAAVEADIFQRIIVSTDDESLFKFVTMLGVDFEVRPPELAGDDVRAEEVFKDVVAGYGKYYDLPDIVCMAMPTAPFTKPESLRNAYENMVGWATFLAVETPFNTIRTVKHSPGFQPYPVGGNGWDEMGMQSQDLEKTYRPTYGGMFVKTKLLLRDTSYYAEEQDMYEVPSWEGIDIDTEDDWQQAERYLSERSN
jgi:CMP-N,N'-diacetyllegionaminic acid synthase